MRPIHEDLEQAQREHGHLCHGMVLGVRMARRGCLELGIDDPPRYRDLMVYVEMDRCATDAVSAVTGATLGRRRLKWIDYGKMAATFVNLKTGGAIRVAARTDAPHGEREDDPLSFWDHFSDDELFTWKEVTIDIPVEDLPGRPLRKAICEACGEQVLDGRHVTRDGRVLCKACSGPAYYRA
jgi:formylmethanofuran dehydrogenase subunit E